MAEIIMRSADGEENRRQGARAERLAERHLKSLGYRLLGRNLHIGGSEIDLLMRDGKTRALVVIEVKSSRIGEHHARAALNAVKRRRIARAVRGLQRLGLAGSSNVRVEAILVDLSRDRIAIRHLA
ncbi:MAG: YraN family protein [Phycisphaerae bacterium]|nr:YraN family protein [Phycisphaerae bacterium]